MTWGHVVCVAIKGEHLNEVSRGGCGEERRLSMPREKPEEKRVAKQSCSKEGAVNGIQHLVSSGA